MAGSQRRSRSAALRRSSRNARDDVVALTRAVPDRLFKGEILLAAEEEEITHGRSRWGFLKDGIDDDAFIAAQAERVSSAPASGAHGPDDICFAAHERNIERVAGDAIPGVGETRAVDKIWMAPGLLYRSPAGWRPQRAGWTLRLRQR